MTRWLLLLLVALCLYTPLAAQDDAGDVVIKDLDSANKVLERGHYAFERGETREAMNMYVKVAQSGYGTASVWSNAGTAAYRTGEIGPAVLYYSRALRIDPGYERARSSLAFVSPATNDAGTGFFSQVVDTIFRNTTPAVWIIGAEIFFLLACLSLARTLAIADRDRRGHWIASLAWALVLCIACVGIGVMNQHFRAGGNKAVVLSEKTITRSEPRSDSTAQLELPAGTIVEMTEEPIRGFVRFKLADGRSGYIQTDQIERI